MKKFNRCWKNLSIALLLFFAANPVYSINITGKKTGNVKKGHVSGLYINSLTLNKVTSQDLSYFQGGIVSNGTIALDKAAHLTINYKSSISKAYMNSLVIVNTSHYESATVTGTFTAPKVQIGSYIFFYTHTSIGDCSATTRGYLTIVKGDVESSSSHDQLYFCAKAGDDYEWKSIKLRDDKQPN